MTSRTDMTWFGDLNRVRGTTSEFRSKISGMLLLCAVLWALSSPIQAAVQSVRCVPWQGNPRAYHTAIAGKEILLKGVITTDSTAAISYEWQFGDGTSLPRTNLSGALVYRIATPHTYSGDWGLEMTATLTAIDGTGSMSDKYLVKIECPGLDSQVNIAIDDGLWYLYTHHIARPAQGDGYWAYGSYHSSATASAVHAFENNFHFETGDPTEDPYAEVVKNGLRFLINSALRPVNASGQAADTNANGIAIEPVDGNPPYQLGMVMDALISTLTPNADCGRDFDGNGGNDTYRQVVQDMCDMYDLGQYNDSRYGGWRYSWGEAPDNSACQWAAIGMIPAERKWGCVIRPKVKEWNYNWLKYSYHATACNGAGFGYTGPSSCGTGNSRGTRPSGLVQLIFCDKDRTDPYWIPVVGWFQNTARWQWFMNQNSYYAWYAFMKAMRLMDEDHPLAIELVRNECGLTPLRSEFLENGFNWYRGNQELPGLAERLLNLQYRTGANRGSWPAEYGDILSTAWSILTLRSNFIPPPCGLFADTNGDGIKQPDEGDAVTCRGAPVVFLLDVNFSEDRSDIITATVEGVPATWVSMPPGDGLSCGVETLAPGQFCFLPGKSYRIPVTITPQEPGEHALRVRLTPTSTQFAGTTPERRLLVSDSELIAEVLPATGITVCNTELEITWKTCGYATGEVRWRTKGAEGWNTRAEDSFGIDHRLVLSGLVAGNEYEWKVRAYRPEAPDMAGETTVNTCRVQPCVGFSQKELTFEITRDYNQVRTVAIKNDDARPYTVRLSIADRPPDLFIDFTGAGSQDDPLTIEAGESRTVSLGLNAQDTLQSSYLLHALLVSDDTPPVVDRCAINIRIRIPRIEFDLTRAPERQAGTLANFFSIHNAADPITDFNADAPAVADRVTFTPTIDHAYVEHAAEFGFAVTPLLEPDPEAPGRAKAIEGSVLATALNGTVVREEALDFSPPEQETLWLAQILSPCYCATGAGWYCTNRPRIAIPFELPGGFVAQNVRSIKLTMTFTPSPRWSHRPHSVFLYLNGEEGRNLIGSIVDTIPSGTYVFENIPPALLNTSMRGSARNTVFLHSSHNSGHYVVTAGARLCICLDSLKRYIYAPDQATADLRLGNLAGLAASATDLVVTIQEPQSGTQLRRGEAALIRARVTSGGTGISGLPVVARLSNADAVFMLAEDNAGETGIYTGSFTPKTAGPLVIEVHVDSCAAGAAATVECYVEASRCDQLVACMNHYFHFYNTTPEEDSLGCPYACLGVPKLRAADLEADNLWVTQLYPARAALLHGEDLTCEVDANLWYAPGAQDPYGRVPLDLGFALKDAIPTEELREMLSHLFGVAATLDGAIARKFPACSDAAPQFLSNVSLRIKVPPALADVEIKGSGDIIFKYHEDECFTIEEGRQFNMEVANTLPGVSVEKGFEFLQNHVAAELILTPVITGSLGLLKPDAGLALPQAVAFAIVADLTAKADVSLDLSEDTINRFFDSKPIVAAEVSGDAYLLAEVAIASEDMAPGATLRSPLYFDERYDHRVAYEGLLAYVPIAHLQFFAELKLTITVTFDLRGSQFPPQTITREFEFDLKYRQPWGNVVATLTGDAELTLLGGAPKSRDKRAARTYTAIAAADATPVQAIVRSPNAGMYGLTLSWPAVYLQAMPDAKGFEEVVRMISLKSANVAAVPGDVDVWSVSPSKLSKDLQALIAGGESPDEAVRLVIRSIDNDRDGIPDVIDPAQDGLLQQPFLELVMPPPPEAGALVMLAASLSYAGNPLADREISFAVVDGEDIGTSTTGADGVATIAFQVPPDTRKTLEIKAAFPGAAGLSPAEAVRLLPTYDNPPTVRIVSPKNGVYPAPSVDVAFLVTDANLDRITVFDNGTSQDCQTSPCMIQGHGWHFVEVVAVDKGGNQSSATVLLSIATRFKRGDANCDGKCDLADAIRVVSYLFDHFKPVAPCDCIEAFDANDDGRIDIGDAIKILGHLFNREGALPAPFAECGVDETIDGLGCNVYANDQHCQP